MKLQILSDLHLGFGEMEVPYTDADVVVLAGDVSRPREAVAWALRFERPVLYVPGNHEYYGGSLDGVARQLAELAAGTQVRLLDDGEVVLGGVRFLGSTLWSDFALFDDEAQRAAAVAEATLRVHDFSRIRTSEHSDALFTPDEAARRCARHAAWLDERLTVPHDGPTVVVTHHAPSTLSIHPRFEGSPLNACFVSDAERLLDGSRAALWVHGHTHDSHDYVRNGTRVVCNPRGYSRSGVNENPRFDPGFQVALG